MDRNELADKLDGMASATFFGPDKDALRQAAAALRESEEWRRDAERYKWLRECSPFRSDRTCYVTVNVYDRGKFVEPIHPYRERLDEYIDAEIDSARMAIDAARKEGV